MSEQGAGKGEERRARSGESEPARLKQLKSLGGPGTVGLEMVLSILFGFGVGRWLDGRFDTTPYLQVVGFGFGVAAAIKALVRSWREMQAEAAREEKEQGNPPPLFERPDEPHKEREQEVSEQKDLPEEQDEEQP